MLFQCIEDCHEVQILREDPYTAQQLLNNAVCLLLQTGLYTRDFEDWDRKIATDKFWTNLRTFIQESYTHRLNASSITSGAHGYVQNVNAALGEESDEEDDDVQTFNTQMAALTTQSKLMASTAAETNALVTEAINQLTATQQAMQHEFAALTSTRNTTYQRAPPAPAPIQQFTIPQSGTFQPPGSGGGGRRVGVHHLQVLWGPEWPTPHWRQTCRWYCAVPTTKCTKEHSTNVFQHHEMVRELECLFLLWF